MNRKDDIMDECPPTPMAPRNFLGTFRGLRTYTHQMDDNSLNQRLASWRVTPTGSQQLAGAVPPPGRRDPVAVWSVAAAVALLAGGAAGYSANQSDRERVLQLYVRQISDSLPR